MLVVKLESMKKMITAGTIEALTDEDYVENSLIRTDTEIYATDSVIYNEGLDNAEVKLKSVIFEDSVFELTNGMYIHSSWIKGTVELKEDKQLFIINGVYYNDKFEIQDIKSCATCGSEEPLVEDSGLCPNCFNEKHSKINSYNYKPTPIFIGEQLKTNVDAPVWYGIELEHACKDRLKAAKFQYKYSKGEKVFYYKHDGSIYSSEFPIEMVTHPHSFSALMQAEWLNKLKDLDTINNEEVSRQNGCHIHVSNTAFIDDKHYAKWYFFVYSLANGILQKIANRECTSFCKNIKVGSLLSKSKNPTEENERQVIINERNNATKEVRMFSTTSDPKVLKSYIQFLESTIKYAKYANTKLSYDNWVAYVTKYSTKYEELLAVLSGITLPKPKELIVPTKEVEVENIYDIPTKYLSNIIKITDKNDNNYKISLCSVDFANERIWLNGRSSEFMFSNLKRITYAK